MNPYLLYPALTLIGGGIALPLYGLKGYRFHLSLLGDRYRWDPSAAPSEEALPTVTVVLPAYNEEHRIEGAIEALLALDYPKDRLQILVLSDASTDATDEIVRGFSDRGVELLRMEERSGKTKAENAAAPHLRGEIIVNTDASIRLHPKAVRRLVERFTDPSVGVASGRDVSVDGSRAGANEGEGGYVDYEMGLRALETRKGGIVGASGSLYAIRRALHLLPVPPGLSRDFSSALTARRHGYRSVSVDDAICLVPRTGSLRREYRRKVRTITRGMHTLIHNRDLLRFRRHGRFAWMLFAHKVLRWAVPWCGVALLLGFILLALGGWTVGWLAPVGAFGALLITGIAWWVEPRRALPRLLSLPAFAVLSNLAVLRATLSAFFGRPQAVWEPTRR